MELIHNRRADESVPADFPIDHPAHFTWSFPDYEIQGVHRSPFNRPVSLWSYSQYHDVAASASLRGVEQAPLKWWNNNSCIGLLGAGGLSLDGVYIECSRGTALSIDRPLNSGSGKISSSVRIDSSHITDCFVGVCVDSLISTDDIASNSTRDSAVATNLHINNTTIDNFEVNGVQYRHPRGKCVIENCEISNDVSSKARSRRGIGLSLVACKEALVSNCDVKKCFGGIYIEDTCTAVTLAGNNIQKNHQYGISVMGGAVQRETVKGTIPSTVTISNCQVLKSGSSNIYVCVLGHSGAVSIDNCSVHSSALSGIEVQQCYYPPMRTQQRTVSQDPPPPPMHVVINNSTIEDNKGFGVTLSKCQGELARRDHHLEITPSLVEIESSSINDNVGVGLQIRHNEKDFKLIVRDSNLFYNHKGNMVVSAWSDVELIKNYIYSQPWKECIIALAGELYCILKDNAFFTSSEKAVTSAFYSAHITTTGNSYSQPFHLKLSPFERRNFRAVAARQSTRLLGPLTHLQWTATIAAVSAAAVYGYVRYRSLSSSSK